MNYGLDVSKGPNSTRTCILMIKTVPVIGTLCEKTKIMNGQCPR
jgi:hypothetical protein